MKTLPWGAVKLFRSAGFQPAVSPISNRQTVRTFQRAWKSDSAGWKPSRIRSKGWKPALRLGGTTMSIELKVPAVGESIKEVEIGGWLKPEGATVSKDESVVTLRIPEKATVELPSPAAGKLTKILKQKGQTAAIGEVIAYLDEVTAPAGAPPSPEKPAVPEPAPATGNGQPETSPGIGGPAGKAGGGSGGRKKPANARPQGKLNCPKLNPKPKPLNKNHRRRRTSAKAPGKRKPCP